MERRACHEAPAAKVASKAGAVPPNPQYTSPRPLRSNTMKSMKLAAAAIATLFALGTTAAFAADDAATTTKPATTKKTTKKHTTKKPAADKSAAPAATPAK